MLRTSTDIHYLITTSKLPVNWKNVIWYGEISVNKNNTQIIYLLVRKSIMAFFRGVCYSLTTIFYMCQCWQINAQIICLLERKLIMIMLNFSGNTVLSEFVLYLECMFVRDLRYTVSGFLWILWFPPPIKLTATI